jgi:hypothetical protein
MKVSINQPAYLPWLGYFERIAKSDLHIVLDHVQFEKNSFTNRNKIHGQSGPVWLTVPLATSGRFGDLAISSLQFAHNQNWQRKHWKSLRMAYSKAPHFSRYAPAYEALYAAEWNSFSPLLRAFLRQHLNDFGISTPLLFSSEMDVAGAKSELVLNLCRATGADCYLSGALGRGYLDQASFTNAGIDIEYQDYHHPVYTQLYSNFTPYLCALDLLFQHGPDSLKILLNSGPST